MVTQALTHLSAVVVVSSYRSVSINPVCFKALPQGNSRECPRNLKIVSFLGHRGAQKLNFSGSIKQILEFFKKL